MRNQLCGSPLTPAAAMPPAAPAAARMSASATMRRPATCSSAVTITMHIVAPVIAPATAAPPPTVIPPAAAAIITSVATHETDASRQGRQQRNPKSNLDPVNRTVRLVQSELTFAEEIKNQVTGR